MDIFKAQDMDKTKDMFLTVMDSWRRKSLGLDFTRKQSANSWFEGSVDVLIGNPTEFKRTVNVTVDENGALIGNVISTSTISIQHR